MSSFDTEQQIKKLLLNPKLPPEVALLLIAAVVFPQTMGEIIGGA